MSNTLNTPRSPFLRWSGFILLALFALLATLQASPADARDKKREAPTFYLPTSAAPEEIQTKLKQGYKVCLGDDKLSDCMIWNPLMQRIVAGATFRPKGIGENLTFGTIANTNSDGDMIRDSAGTPVAALNHVADTPNAAALIVGGIAAVPQAFVNGMGASVVAAIANPCKGGGCQGPSIFVEGAVALAQSGSTANSAANVTSTGACGGNPCAPLPGKLN